MAGIPCPIIDHDAYRQLRDSGSGIAKAFGRYAIHKAADSLLGYRRRRRPHGTENSVLSDLGDGIIEVASEWAHQDYQTLFSRLFPKPAAWYGFSRGTTITDELYTVQWDITDSEGTFTAEIPIYIKSAPTNDNPNPANPSDDELRRGIKYIKDHGRSQYNEANQMSGIFNPDFNLYSLRKYTRGDSERWRPQNQLNGWLGRRDFFIIHEKGKVIEERNTTLGAVDPTDGATYRIRKYKNPSKFNVWLYNFVGDKIYDAIDWFWDFIGQDNLPEQAQQNFLKREFRFIDKLARTPFRSYERYPLIFDLGRGMREHRIGMAA